MAFEDIPAWAEQLINDVSNLSKDISAIREDTKLIPQILEIVQANGQGIEVISSRVDRLELAQ